MNKALTAALAAVLLASPACAEEPEPAPPANDTEASALLTVLTSADPQTQLMALILTRASVQAGADTQVLLCSAAGDLALSEPPEAATAPLAPRGMSPHGLLRGLIADGVEVQVCAIYLPNSPHADDDLVAGVGVATPPAIAARMTDPDVKLFTF
ncbi:hypothetical protein DDZ18_06940 [Marinicauda salina]|uniref:Peroxiredoxin n=1 Tax=Marinicauda salina TaxID=2135793 RepID=A0A2U2BTS9_9PROT|nr:hypothetical protein [Marinicauda salina]PWE17411.1 hypothetical protein DDZ18_06940 [Marinicauda salina]